MTVIEAYRAILIELNKVQAPSLLLDDFIYLFNKGVQQYINERYNIFETKQQLTDDLRVLIKSEQIYRIDDLSKPAGALTFQEQKVGTFGESYRTELPNDYLHILNCTCQFKDLSPRCYGKNDTITVSANKLNTNQWAQIVNNYYLKPSVRNPYYYIVNIDDPQLQRVSDETKKANVSGNIRYGNNVKPLMQVKCGDDSRYQLQYVFVDYLRSAIYYSISQDDLDSVQDNSQVIEFPDYVTYEIINRITKLILENGKDPRTQTHFAVNQSVA